MTSPGDHPPDGFVLAGGRSSRFGEDKAAARVDGVPAAVRVAVALGAVCGRVRVVRRGDQAPAVWRAPDGRVFDELRGDEGEARHPLWGVAAALEAAASARVVLSPCDLAWLSREAVEALWAARRPAYAVDPTGEHPLLLVAPRADAARARALAAAGAPARAFVAGWARVEVDPRAASNMNRPTDGPVGTTDPR